METGEILRRFFPLRSHLQVFHEYGRSGNQTLSLKFEISYGSKMSRSSRYYTCTFWMVNFHTFKGRWGIPNICYIFSSKGRTHFVSKRFRKWLLCQAKLPNGGKHESGCLAKSMIASTMASHFQVSAVLFRYPSMGFNWIQHPAVGCYFFKPCRWFCDARNLHLMQLGGFDDVEGWRLSSSCLHKIQIVFKFWAKRIWFPNTFRNFVIDFGCFWSRLSHWILGKATHLRPGTKHKTIGGQCAWRFTG